MEEKHAKLGKRQAETMKNKNKQQDANILQVRHRVEPSRDVFVPERDGTNCWFGGSRSNNGSGGVAER